MEDKLKWFVIWNSHLEGWAVMKGGFKAGHQKTKYLAEQWKDELNELDNSEHEGHLVDNFV